MGCAATRRRACAASRRRPWAASRRRPGLPAEGSLGLPAEGISTNFDSPFCAWGVWDEFGCWHNCLCIGWVVGTSQFGSSRNEANFHNNRQQHKMAARQCSFNFFFSSCLFLQVIQTWSYLGKVCLKLIRLGHKRCGEPTFEVKFTLARKSCSHEK